MHRGAAYGSARANQRGCVHPLKPPSKECKPPEHRLSAVEDAPLAIVSCHYVHGLSPHSLLLTLYKSSFIRAKQPHPTACHFLFYIASISIFSAKPGLTTYIYPFFSPRTTVQGCCGLGHIQADPVAAPSVPLPWGTIASWTFLPYHQQLGHLLWWHSPPYVARNVGLSSVNHTRPRATVLFGTSVTPSLPWTTNSFEQTLVAFGM